MDRRHIRIIGQWFLIQVLAFVHAWSQEPHAVGESSALVAASLQPARPVDPNAEAPTIAELEEKLIEAQQRILRLEQFGGGGVGGAYVPSFEFMPPPADPNNLFRDESTADINLGAGSRVPGTAVIFRSLVNANVHARYDSGLVSGGSTFRPTNIALDGTQAAHGRGVFELNVSQATLNLDVQIPLQTDIEQLQGYLETDVIDSDLRVRHVFARAGNLLAGQYWTTWGDEGALPKALGTDLRPAGALYNRPVQLRLAFPSELGWVTTVAIEQAITSDFAVPIPGDTVLQRYPDFALRWRYFDGDFASLSFGALVRAMGVEHVNGAEEFAVGWGFSAATRFRLTPNGALMMGFVGGEGLTGSIWGLSPGSSAAGLSAPLAAGGEFIPTANYGTYIGYQQIWNERLKSSFAYGFAQADLTPQLAPFTDRTSHNAWANLIYQVNDNFGVGVEYVYGTSEALNGISGDNHRLLFVVALRTSQKSRQQGAALTDADATFAPADTGPSRFSRL